MQNQPIKKTIAISASRERVWDVVLNDRYTRIWYEEFSLGARPETTWEEGSKVVFTDVSGGGLVGQVVVNHPLEMVSVEYQGVMNAGYEEYESDYAQEVKGGHETYTLTSTGNLTELTVETDMPLALFETMSLAWERALRKIRKLSEDPMA
jgi:uncharacterized protein YndB with AHSA1/START domain